MSIDTWVFSYGSNSVVQLRKRVENDELVAYPAFLDGWKRIFCMHTSGWGCGGVASLTQCSELCRVYGAAVKLSSVELARLDKFEKPEYTTVNIDITVSTKKGDEVISAVTYICRTPEWILPPTEQYLTAIHLMLREQWNHHPEALNIPIYGLMKCISDATDEIKMHDTWLHPGDHALTLPALCVEVNARLDVCFGWVMPRTMNEITKKFSLIGITSPVHLAEYLITEEAMVRLNQKLVGNGEKDIAVPILRIFRSLLFKHPTSIKILTNAKLVLSDRILLHSALVLYCNKIIAVLPEDCVDIETYPAVDVHGCYVAPGLMDLQVYGSSGKLFGGDPRVDSLEQMEKDFLRQGTTYFLAAVATNSMEVFHRATSCANAFIQSKDYQGCFGGLHFEGPFINQVKRAAHIEEFVCPLTKYNMDNVLMGDDQQMVKMMTIAPELVEDDKCISMLRDHGIVLSFGHTNATYEEAKRCLQYQYKGDKMIQAVTHLYNAMPPMHHRTPGCIPAIVEEQPYCSIVADGIHVDYPMIHLAKRLLNKKLYLITDAVTECTDGGYQHRFEKDRYVMPDGTLSGSALSMIAAVRNCVVHCNISLWEAISMATTYPAQLMGVGDRNGLIAAGYDANLVVFDENYVTKMTFLQGVKVFDSCEKT